MNLNLAKIGTMAAATLIGLAGCAAKTDAADDWRAGVINNAADILENEYIYEDKAAVLASYLRDNHAKYTGIEEKSAFAKELTTDLYELANDKHLRVFYAPETDGEGDGAGPEGQASPRPNIAHCQTAALTYEIAGDVGLVVVPRFFGDEAYGAKLDEAMKAVADTSAMALDLRDNCGGGPMIVRQLSTYFFDEKTHLVSTEARGEDTRERWTLDDVAGARYIDKPLYILTNKHTFSAAESFTFGMKATGRALTVGEGTGGGGHFGSTQRISSDFTIFVPVGRTFDPRSGMGWEATGIAPDIESAPEDAFDAARAHFEETRAGE